MASPRIAICGAGISGLSLAGMLSRRLKGAGRIFVYERAKADRDQGYGLDLDEHGQEALARAGVYDRFWEIARPRSDAGMAFFQASAHGPDIRPSVHLYQPRWAQRLFPNHMAARPECNREKLRDILLDAIAERDNTSVHFETGTGDCREVFDSEGNSTAELFDLEGNSLGEFDLVVDAMGLHSTLRHLVVDDPIGKHFEGSVMIHGSIKDPEACFSPELMARFRNFGTSGVFCKKADLFIQRYGAGADDRRTSFFYTLYREDGEDGLFAELGIDKPSSREGGIMRDSERLAKVRSWVKQHMGDDFCPVWKEVIDHVDRLTVRNDVTHGPTKLRPPGTMPLICIGDSLRNCGLGGGGMLAMQDSIELCKVLLPDDGETTAPVVFDPVTGRADLAPLRSAVEKMLALKNEQADGKRRRSEFQRIWKDDRDGNLDFTWDDFRQMHELGSIKYRAMRLLLPWVQALVSRSYAADLARGEAGSTKANAIIYKNVTDYLAREASRA
eukprot:TRINITY_DN40757_c0_g2_i1.p1 TRINITY_DN40757_c0_g2~~TRINITY_DN40757_c0_g2_i1.p1  ORF type:complete len:501 (+),score=74.54 TRINITY_DN40757_c0_g2_i1:298-1800(+)